MIAKTRRSTFAAAVFALCALVPGCSSPPAPIRAADHVAAEARTDDVSADPAIERSVAEQVNEVRREKGLAALRVDQALARVARDYSCRMVREGFFSHVAPSGETMADRVRKSRRYRSVAENIGVVTNVADPAKRAVTGWMQSPTHRENILTASFTETGVGGCRRGRDVYFTQIFLEPA